MSEQRFLRRYTTLPSALDILKRQQLTLLSPDTWDDGNDRYYLERFAQKHDCASVLALCFSEARETYHHWRVFTSGTEGVCIEFERDSLFQALPDSIERRAVRYVKINDIVAETKDWKDWPFVKRLPFSDEQEYRLLYVGDESESPARSFPIPLETVRRVTTSPWLPRSLHEVVRELIKEIKGCEDLEVRRTTLVDNERWKSALSQ